MKPLPLILPCVLLCLAAACGSTTYFLDEAGLARFEAAGPATLELDEDQLLGLRSAPGPYRLVAGDLLEIFAPDSLFDPDQAQRRRLSDGGGRLVRVAADGTMTVPVLGAVRAAGRTLLELEQALVEQAHPRFLRRRPAIVVRVAEYRRTRVTVLGAVTEPGIVELRHDEMDLFGALSASGGIQKSGNLVVGARLIRVRRPGREGAEHVVLPVKGLNVPVANVELRGGEVIEVERYEPDTVTVTGLVRKPGAYAYPPEVELNLMQAIARAGGVDTVADPPYATVFRKTTAGEILPATFSISGDGLVQASAMRIKPGDVIVLGHTTASWTRSLIAEIFRFNVGFFYDVDDRR